MDLLITQTHFELILNILLSHLSQATTPKEAFAASDRITRLASLHYKIHLRPAAKPSKVSDKTSTIQSPPPVAVAGNDDLSTVGLDADSVSDSEATPSLPQDIAEDVELVSRWMADLPSKVLKPKLLSEHLVKQQDPHYKRHKRISNLGIVPLHIFNQMDAARMLTEDKRSLIPLAYTFYKCS